MGERTIAELLIRLEPHQDCWTLLDKYDAAMVELAAAQERIRHLEDEISELKREIKWHEHGNKYYEYD